MFGMTTSSRALPRFGPLWRADIGDHVIALAWSPSGTELVAASVSGPIALLNAKSGAVIATLRGHGFGTTSAAWNADGSHFASSGQDGKVRLWDLATAKERLAVAGGAPWVEHVAWSPKENLLVSAAGRKLRLWDPQGRLVREYPDHPSTIAGVQWRPGTLELASAAYGRLAIWRPDSPEPVRTFAWKGSILTLAWSPDGRYIATGDQDATVHFWITKSGKDLQMSGYQRKVRELAWDSTSRHLATGGGPVPCVWDCSGKGPAGTTPVQLKAHTKEVTALAFQPGTLLLASAGADGQVLLWELHRQKPVAQGRLDAGVAQLLWSADGKHLAAGSDRGHITVFAVL
jgi:WD40 repeat protein